MIFSGKQTHKLYSKTRRAGKLSIRKTAPIFKEASSNYALKSQ